MKFFNLAIIAIIITACTPFPPQQRDEKQKFFLSDIESFPDASKNPEVNLIVDEVETNAGLDTNKIAMTDKNQLNYFRDTYWAEDLSEVIRSTLIESLENSDKFNSVTTELHGVRGNYALSINVRNFQAVNGNKAAVKIVTKLIELPRRKVLLNFTSESKKDAVSSSINDIVAALDSAFSEVQKDIVERITAFLDKKNNLVTIRSVNDQ